MLLTHTYITNVHQTYCILPKQNT